MIYLRKPSFFKPSVEVVAAYIWSRGQVLFLKRALGKSEEGLYGLPAGKINAGEERLAALMREVEEETGFNIQDYPIAHHTPVYVTWPEKHFIYHMYEVKIPQPTPSPLLNPDEHSDFVWVTPKESLLLATVPDQDVCTRLMYPL